MPEFRIAGNEVSFWLQVKPRASRERLTEGRQGALRLELHAPATEDQANEARVRTERMMKQRVHEVSIAFSSEVDTGSRIENASNKKLATRCLTKPQPGRAVRIWTL